MTSKLYQDIRDWLTDYLKPEELEGVSSLMYHIARKHGMVSFRIGLFLGFIGGIILLKWLS